jgi:ArsR family transcriptional regulator
MRRLLLVAKTFSDPTRVRMMAALRGGEVCVCELCDGLGITQSTLSTHLQVIRRSGLVRMRRDGKWCYYRLAPGAERWVDFFFESFEGEMAKDRRILADANRLKRRLELREKGGCCVGGVSKAAPRNRRNKQ